MIEKLLEQLITFKTTHEAGNKRQFDELFDYVNCNLSGLSLAAKKFTSNKHTSWLWSSKPNPSILLSTHIDVVPGHVDQFTPIAKKNTLYGRGAIDMKFAIATFIDVLKGQEKKLSELSVGLLLTSDEEIGGENGTKYVLDQTNIQPKCVLLPDGGRNMTIEHAEKGFWHVRLIASGKAAHGSRPWLGENAIDKLFHLYSFLQKMFPTPSKDEWVTTINAGRIHGGSAINTVPDEAYIDLDIRYTDVKIKKKIHSVLKKFEEMGITIQTLIEGSPYYLPSTNTFLKRYQNIARDTIEVTPHLIKSAGSSDARYFAERDIPVIVSSPVGDGLHSNREWINLSSLESYKKIVEEFVISSAS